MTMRRAAFLVLLVWLIGHSQLVHAHKVETHREIARRAAAAEVSSVDRILREQLGFDRGIREAFNGREVTELIGEGAVSEDVPVWRTFNHFHNPLEPWDQAGLNVLGASGQSSVLWQQNPNQDTTIVRVGLFFPQAGGGNRSWQDARREYLLALTEREKKDRDIQLGNTFETLGHLTHLIQDATPAHTRNDSHPIYEGYERHVERVRAAPAGSARRTLFDSWLNSGPKIPPISIFTPTGDTQAPVPIARLIDTDTFDGLNAAPLTNLTIGVAEYTNGNFLSDDTIFSGFTLPRRESLAGQSFFEPADQQRYFEKVGEGQTIRHFVAESTLNVPVNEELGGPVDQGLVLTRLVYQDYAAELIPRAVGYSAGLLDYFFRGRLDVDVVASAADPSQLELSVTNRSSETIGPGTLFLYAEDADGVRCPVPTFGSDSVPDADPNCPPGNGAQPVSTTVAPGDPVSALSLTFQKPQSARFVLVYEGQLGLEENAVIGKVFAQRLEIVAPASISPEAPEPAVDTFVIFTAQGQFAIDLGFPIDPLDASWGDNPNIILLKYVDPVSFKNTLAIFRINRTLDSVEMPVKKDGSGNVLTLGTLPIIDGSVIATFEEVDGGIPLGRTVSAKEEFEFETFIDAKFEERSNPNCVIPSPAFCVGIGSIPNQTQTVSFRIGTTTQNLTFEESREMTVIGQGYTTRLLHSFVNKSNQLIQVYAVDWKLDEILSQVENEDKVKVFSADVPNISTIASRLATAGFTGGEDLPFFRQGNGLIGPVLFQNIFHNSVVAGFNIGGLSITPYAFLKVRPARIVPSPNDIFDIFALNRSTGQVVGASFTNPRLEYERKVTLPGFVAMFRDHFDGGTFPDHFDSLRIERPGFSAGPNTFIEDGTGFLQNNLLNPLGPFYFTDTDGDNILNQPVGAPFATVKNVQFLGRGSFGDLRQVPNIFDEIPSLRNAFSNFSSNPGFFPPPLPPPATITHPGGAIPILVTDLTLLDPAEPKFVTDLGLGTLRPLVNKNAFVFIAQQESNSSILRSILRWPFTTDPTVPIAAQTDDPVLNLRAHDHSIYARFQTFGDRIFIGAAERGFKTDFEPPSNFEFIEPGRGDSPRPQRSYTNDQTDDRKIYQVTVDPDTGLAIVTQTTAPPNADIVQTRGFIFPTEFSYHYAGP